MHAETTDFQPGDVIEFDGETYQVLEPRDGGALAIPFPSDHVPAEELRWQEPGAVRRIGSAQLPGPTPCSTAAGCSGTPADADDSQLICRA